MSTQLRIYYLDDEQDLLEMFVDQFLDLPLEITTFSDPTKALQAIESSPPDLLVLDYRLPGTTGDQIALKVDANIPKVLITGEIQVNLNAKYEAVLKKPNFFDGVCKIIDEISARKK